MHVKISWFYKSVKLFSNYATHLKKQSGYLRNNLIYARHNLD